MIAVHLYFEQRQLTVSRPRTRVRAQGREGRRGGTGWGGGLAAPGVASRKTGGRLSKAGERQKEKTLIKLLIHWAPRAQTHWPDCLAGCVCASVCVCVCVPVSAPPTPNMPSPRVTTSLCPTTHPSTPLAFPKHEALPRPPSQPHSRQDSLGVGLGPRPAAEELRAIHGRQCGPGSICPPHTPSPLPQHPPSEKREGLRSVEERPGEALDDEQDRKMEGSPCWGRG